MTYGQSWLEQLLGTPCTCHCGRRYNPNVSYDGGTRKGHPRRYCSRSCRDRASYLRRTGRDL